MLYKKIYYASMAAYAVMNKPTLGATYWSNTKDTKGCSSAGANDKCVFLCDTQDWKSDFDCGNAGICEITCSQKQCLMDSTITATHSAQLNVKAGDYEEKCYKKAEFHLPNTGSAYFSATSKSVNPFQEMVVNAGSNTKSIYIDCAGGDKHDECKQLTVNAQTADSLYINIEDSDLNGKDETNRVSIHCPRNAISAPQGAPCYINAKNGANLYYVTIYTLYGMPHDVWIEADSANDWWDVALTCSAIHNTLQISTADILNEDTNKCWKTRAPSSITASPSNAPTMSTQSPSAPTSHPTTDPTSVTASPTVSPTHSPTLAPTLQPTLAPTSAPSTTHPTVPTAVTPSPTLSPTISPTDTPTAAPTADPTLEPISKAPTSAPSNAPTSVPSNAPIEMRMSTQDIVTPKKSKHLIFGVWDGIKPTLAVVLLGVSLLFIGCCLFAVIFMCYGPNIKREDVFRVHSQEEAITPENKIEEVIEVGMAPPPRAARRPPPPPPPCHISPLGDVVMGAPLGKTNGHEEEQYMQKGTQELQCVEADDSSDDIDDIIMNEISIMEMDEDEVLARPKTHATDCDVFRFNEIDVDSENGDFVTAGEPE